MSTSDPGIAAHEFRQKGAKPGTRGPHLNLFSGGAITKKTAAPEVAVEQRVTKFEGDVAAQLPANGPEAQHVPGAHLGSTAMSTRKNTTQAEADDIVNYVGATLVAAMFRDGKSLEEAAVAQMLHPATLAMFGLQFAGRIFERLQPTYSLGNDPKYVEAEMSRMRAQIDAMDALLPPELRIA